MPNPTATVHHSSFKAPQQTQLPQPPQQSPIQRKSVKSAADSVHFGSDHSTQSSPQANHENESFWHRTPVVKNLVAGFKNGFKEFKKGSLFNYFGGGIVATILTFPLNGMIPGSQILVIGWYMLMRRSWDGAKGFLAGLKNPEQFLKPTPSPSEI